MNLTERVLIKAIKYAGYHQGAGQKVWRGGGGEVNAPDNLEMWWIKTHGPPPALGIKLTDPPLNVHLWICKKR